MSLPTVNVKRSLQKGRLVYELNFGLIFSNILAYGVICMLIIFSVVLLIPALLFKPIPSVLSYLLSLSTVTWLVADLVLVNKLSVIRGGLQESNKKRMEIALQQFNGKMTTVANNENTFIQVTPVGWLSWGSVVTVLFIQEKVYVNISSLGRGRDNISPFHALYNYYKSKKLIGIYNSIQY